MGITKFDQQSLMRQSEKITKEVCRLVFEEADWELCKTSRFGTIHKSKGSFDHKSHSFKAETRVNLPSKVLEDLLHPTEHYRPMWDPFVDKVDILVELDDTHLLCHQKLKPTLRGLLSARDVIDVVEFLDTPEYTAVAYGSVEEEKLISPDSKHVRAYSYPSGVFCFPTEDPEWTRVIVLFQAEMNFSAMVPRSIQEAATPTMLNQYITALSQDSPNLVPITPLIGCVGRRKK